MTVSTVEELQALLSTPEGILSAINEKLEQIHYLDDGFFHLTGVRVAGSDVPDYLDMPDLDEDVNEEIVYGISGATAPRLDGAVRVKDWDVAIDLALESEDDDTLRWGHMRDGQRWMFIQDTLVGNTNIQQRLNTGYNCANARMMNGFLGGGKNAGFSWPAYAVIQTPDGGHRLSGDAIPDAFAVSDNRTDLSGKVISPGYSVKDMGKLAKKSLEHFKLTSKGATTPYSTSAFGGKK